MDFWSLVQIWLVPKITTLKTAYLVEKGRRRGLLFQREALNRKESEITRSKARIVMEFPSLSSEIPPLTDLVSSLEQATLMAKQLPSTTDPTQVFHISSSLQNAHHQLSIFLSRFHSSQPHQAAENSPSSVVGEGEPMQLEDDDDDDDDDELDKEEKVDSRVLVENVEERMKNCFLQSKRRKRTLSPSSIAVEQRLRNEVQGFPATTIDPQATRLRSLELVYQFHG